jgi:hypothetical protein
MLWSMVALLGLGMGCLHFIKISHIVSGEIVSYIVDSHLILKELNSHSGVVAEAVQDFAPGDIIH